MCKLNASRRNGSWPFAKEKEKSYKLLKFVVTPFLFKFSKDGISAHVFLRGFWYSATTGEGNSRFFKQFGLIDTVQC